MKTVRTREGRDEMNLVDFAYFTLSKRAPANIDLLEFEDEVNERGETIKRRVTIRGDAQYGLPTAREEEVLLELLRTAKYFNDFQSSRVEFHQGELLEQLGWGRSSRDYKRLERAFFTLNGARYTVCGWRDNGKKVYTTKGAFSLLGDFELRDGRKKVRCSGDRETHPGASDRVTSYFYFGQVLYESLRHGYIKKLDMEALRQLNSRAAKRLYRFLDKHFYPPRRTRLEYSLKELAYKRVGIRDNADVHAIKKVIRPAVAELEQIGFLEPESWEQRCKKIRSGDYVLRFDMAGTRNSVSTKNAPNVTTGHQEKTATDETWDRQFAAFLAVWKLWSLDRRLKFEKEAVEASDATKRNGYMRFTQTIASSCGPIAINPRGSGPSAAAFLCYREKILFEYRNRLHAGKSE